MQILQEFMTYFAAMHSREFYYREQGILLGRAGNFIGTSREIEDDDLHA
jgi:hypothetical protein